ncbi:M20/M25/M40 family metallo-hydrolase [Pelotomaculum terephthalicicum JT]|uniref:M20/M25/M40 family metallo-hydrolase n=1 Tax=Pelotomaculum TaxID=191373 RepID=UPI0009CE4B23|nr:MULTISPECIES: M20/M25/M40 family metallo-hydrolase [Pelotomaculum]MCG9968808.1 M20/M25/M40 family metallo-hydrolase [Pelotomaculum terephthalicicum JT]OPX89757.1 MAG: Peptidase T [Pelotomaculum sp. PtaB.Bin117]
MHTADRTIEEFLELVQVDSVSGKERRMADLLKKKLTALGLEVWEDEAGKKAKAEAGNIIARLPGTGKGPVLLLSAHMDTVEPGCGIRPKVENGVVSSIGETVLGADDKAGIAAILESLRLVIENDIVHGGLEAAFTIWEEGGLFGAKNLDYSLISARTCFVLDSDGQPGTIVTVAPSHDRIGATVRGRAAHAGINPEEGVNAIQVAAHAIAQMKVGRIDHETTSNIGVISGGKAVNIVPDSVTIQGESRSLSAEKRMRQTGQMRRAIEDAAEKFGARADIAIETIYPEFNLPEDSPPVRIAVEAARNLGLEPILAKTGGGSDANIFNSKGIATAVLGIGMKKVHTTEEYITVADLLENVRYLFEIIKVAQKIKY